MKICIHLHLFYTEMLDEMLRYIDNFSTNKDIEYDLYVTLCKHNKKVEDRIFKFKDNAQIIVVSNRGYDLAPFLHVSKMINLDDYDYIIKLHSKRDLPSPAYLPTCRLKRDKWRIKLLEFMSSPKHIRLTLKRFEKSPDIGMISSPELIISSQKEDTSANIRAERIMRGMGLQMKNHKFVAGTMFIARAKLFRMWQMLPYDAMDFEEFDVSHKGGTLAHALERVLGYMIAAQGYKIASYQKSKLYFYLKVALYKFRNFVFYKRVNSKNKLHIKICKIPVYSKQL